MRICLSVFLTVLGLAAIVRADNVVLVAGGGDVAENVAATSAKLGMPFGVEFDKAGNLYFVEIDGHRACRIDKAGMLTRIAGTTVKGLSDGGGKPLAAQFNALHNLAIAPNDDIYLGDTLNHRVCKIDAKTGVFSTVVGTGEKGFSGDGGPAVKAKFSGIYCASLDPSGERIYVADLDNRRIRKIDLKSGIVTTVAGNGEKGVPADGSEAAKAPLVDPRAVTVDKAGNVYVLERGGHALRVVDPQGKIRTVVGTGQKGASGDDGPGLAATMNGPKHLCIDRDGGVLIADTENHIVRKYWPADGRITRVAGSGKKGTGGVPGPALAVEMNQPHGVYVHPNGEIYISDATNRRILKIVK
jgi:DNA-binding beta-propeller fold protein YncE